MLYLCVNGGGSTVQNMSLADTFQQYFHVDYATSNAQKQDVFKIRYNVYCEEFQFEKTDAFPDEIEFDEFDHQSRHCLVTHKATHKPAGCVRLVPTYSNEVRDPLPLEKFCASSLDRALLDGLHLERNTLCEISRLAVDGTFRKRPGEEGTRCGRMPEPTRTSEQELRTYPLIAVSAFLASTALTEITGRTNVLMMMEPFLPRLLSKSGIAVTRAGQDIDYHGIRAAYFITTDYALSGMRADLKGLYDAVFEQIDESYRAAH